MTSPNATLQRPDEARRAILGLIDEHLSVVKPEVLERLQSRNYDGGTSGFDPHILGPALQQLVTSGDIVADRSATRGGPGPITTYQPAHSRRRRTAIAEAAARKRLLYARYLSWATSNLLGPPAERAVRAGITMSTGMQPAEQGAGEVSTILGVHLPGPADSGGFMVPLNAAGVPQPPITVLIEIKNVREVIYPNSSELYQVLFKAVTLQTVHQSTAIVPIFICRKSHITTIYMARKLGFYVLEMSRQYVSPAVEQRLFEEVRNELQFSDLYRGDEPSLRIRDRLGQIRNSMPRAASTWATTALDPDIAPLIGRIRNEHTRPAERSTLMEQLRAANVRLGRVHVATGTAGW